MAGVPESNRSALETLFDETDGRQWRRNNGWLMDLPLGQWFGVETTDKGEVKHLMLHDNRLRGSIPDTLSSLTQLGLLHLRNNQLSGSIPDSLSSLKQLGSLSLENNQLSGCIPGSLSSLTQLGSLSLENNQLSGGIPDSLSSLTQLRSITLENNQLSGSIPDSLSSLTKLVSLHLENNQLSGSIPDSLSSLTQLECLQLENNQLSGSIPDSLSSLTKLVWLQLENNQLSGDVPSSFSRLRDLQELSLCGNEIDFLPPELEPSLRDRGKFWSEVNRRRQEHRDYVDVAMQERSWLRQGVNAFSKLWHVIIPVVDGITDYVLLWHTSDSDQRVLWWICLVALALADADRAYALLYLVVAMITLIFTVLVAALGSVVECWTGVNFGDIFGVLTFIWKPAELLSGGQPHPRFVHGLLLDAAIWTVLGPRSRYSHKEFGGEDPAAGAQRAGSDVKIIDVFLEWHPYRWCGHLLFRCPVVLRVPSSDRGRTRRALVMLKAVGETVVVDILFLVLGVVSGGSLNDVVAILSSVFSILELVIELQYYVNEAEPYLVQDDAASGGCLRGQRLSRAHALSGQQRSGRDVTDEMHEP